MNPVRKFVAVAATLLVLMAALLPGVSHADDASVVEDVAYYVSHAYHYSSCTHLERKIEHLEERRREGYSSQEGEHLKKKLRKARERWRELGCRRTGTEQAG